MREILFAAMLAACSGTVGQAADEGLASCGADLVQTLIGQPAAEVQEGLPKTVRIIPPDSMITQDFRPTRMNVDLDTAGAIARIWCG